MKAFYANSELSNNAAPGLTRVNADSGFGDGFWWQQVPRETAMDRLDMPSALVEIVTPQDSLETFLVSGFAGAAANVHLQRPQV